MPRGGETLVGELGVRIYSSNSHYCVAKSPSKLAEIEQDGFHFLVQQTPHFATHVIKLLAHRVR